MSVFTSWFGMSDEQAMWRVQMHDDSQAFAQLLTRWEGPIKRLCIRMLHDEHKAEDMTQEAFARVYARRKDFQHGSKFSTFIWRVAMNLCLDELRRLKRRREFSAVAQTLDSSETEIWEDLPSAGPSPHDSASNDEEAELVRKALAQLPEHYRSVVVLRHYEDLKFREIADVLNVPEGTVKSRMAEALALLGQALKRSMADPVRRKHAQPPIQHTAINHWAQQKSAQPKEALVL